MYNVSTILVLASFVIESSLFLQVMSEDIESLMDLKFFMIRPGNVMLHVADFERLKNSKNKKNWEK